MSYKGEQLAECLTVFGLPCKFTELKKELQQLKNQSPLHKHVINEIIRDSGNYSGSFQEKLKVCSL